jgi:hypothetical protein
VKTTPLFLVSLVLLGVYVVAALAGADLPTPWSYIVVGASIVGFTADIVRKSRAPRVAESD